MTEENKYKDKLANFNPAKAINGSQKYFSENKFGAKMVKYAKDLGTKLAYYSFLLYFAFKSPNTPKSAKLTIAGALGYLILPVDMIPDFIPVVGLTDDSAVIVYALYRIYSHIDEEMKQQADEKMKKYFGEDYDKHDIEDNLVVKEDK